MKISNVAYLLISLIGIVIILIYGKGLLIPFVFAVLLWFIIREIRQFLDRSKFIRNRLPSWLKNIIVTLIILSTLALVSRIVTSSINKLAKSYPEYEANIELIIIQINAVLNIDLMDFLRSHSGDFDFGSILGSVFNSISDLLGNAFIILIYALFLILEESHFHKKLQGIFKSQSSLERVKEILSKIENSTARYLGLKTVVSLITGTLSYIALLIIGIDAPAFWAFLIFILNYIPTIGSLIATLFPAIFCLLQFGELTPGISVLIFVGSIQLAVGNLLEPRLMGGSLNVSPLVTIVSLSFWGALWGITGMILSVPITVIGIIIFSQFERTQAVAILLSEKGKV